jgi:7,8-dihydro-6-hydroxymethylpterin-pyrophosphokinase
VASHLHMTAGAVETTMSAHELFCWGYLLYEEPKRVREQQDAPRVLEVDDEIAEWG